MSANRVRVNISLPPQTLAMAKRQAADQGTDVSKLLDLLIEANEESGGKIAADQTAVRHDRGEEAVRRILGGR